MWGRAGTDLEWVKTSLAENDLFLSATAYSRFSRTTVITMFVYGADEFPVATVDIGAGRGSGLALLWMPTNPDPVVVGNFVAGEYFAEVQIWLDVLLEAVPEITGVEGTVEIATAASRPGLWEEFVLARVPLSTVFGQ
jgi:hypothetical protein